MKKAYEKALEKYLSRDDVTSVAIGLKFKDGQWTNEPCISIGVKEKKPIEELKKGDILPKTILKVKTDIIEMNPKPLDHTLKLDPLQGGVSIGREGAGYSGTVGCVVFKDGEPYGLTNYHVVVSPNLTTIGEWVTQPSAPDGGKASVDRIGKIESVNLDTNGDLALVKLDVSLRQYNQIIYEEEVGFVSAVVPIVGDLITKSGRSTGITNGKVASVGTFAVDYSAWGKGTVNITGFTIIPLVDPNEEILLEGDSGSAVYLTNDNSTAVGVLCSGSWTPCVGVASFMTTALNILGLTMKQDRISVQTSGNTTDETIAILNIPWMSSQYGDVQTVDITFDKDYSYVFLYVDSEYEGVLEAKISGETNYKVIGAYSQIPSCVIGNFYRNVKVSVDIKTNVYTDLVGFQIIPIYVSYGNSAVTGLNIADFAWKTSDSVIGSWAGNESEAEWLAWSEIS